MNKKKIYFISDVHLGLPNHGESLEREKKLVQWLEDISADADKIFMLGDMFDFWWEYRHVVPRGFVRFLGKLADLTDRGIEVHFFIGNHDQWVRDYLPCETGVILHKGVYRTRLMGKQFTLAHGDGLGPSDFGYKLLKFLFGNKILRWLFSRLHPNFAVGLARTSSNKKRFMEGYTTRPYKGDDKEWLAIYVKEEQEKNPSDFFIFGHRHLALDKQIGQSRMIILGDWIHQYTYAVWDGEDIRIKTYQD